jgi:glycosyltransferase involved in cell wall biosynthesis
MSKSPIVSVVMAVYNTERFLAQAIDSILKQSFQDFELMIVDDGSTDRSLKIAQQYAAKDDRIQLITQPNQGIPKTRNVLLQAAKAELIAVMDSDDVAFPDRLKQQVEFLQRHPEIVCVGSFQDWIDEAGRLLFNHTEPESNDAIQPLLLGGRTCISNPSAMMRRQALVQIGGYDESLPQVEDLDVFLKLGEIGQLANLPETLLQYRQHLRSISAANQMREIDLRRQVCEAAWRRRGITGQLLETSPNRPYDRSSRHAYLMQYGWRFFLDRQRMAAVIYGWRAVSTLPLKLEGWKLLLSALVKPLPKVEAL